jgi:hypothetical protein
LDWSSAGCVQLTEGAAIRAANCAFMDGNGINDSWVQVAKHHRVFEQLE